MLVYLYVDEFAPFLDKRTGAFMEALKDDTKAVLSLYDASYLAMEGETLLVAARSFASGHLREYVKGNSDNELHGLVKHGLELPHYLRARKLDARWFIDEYERKKNKNPKLLELAKLVYNISQAGYHSSVTAKSKYVSKLPCKTIHHACFKDVNNILMQITGIMII